MNRWFAPGLLLIAGLALALRLPELDRRPMHNDEGVNAMRFRSLWVSNTYQYDPNEFHGPTLEYSTVPSAWLSASHDFNSFTESTFRRVTVTFGVGLILLLFLLADALGKLETLWAAGLTAISPAMVFYSRYYIHEMLLVFFTALTVAACWRSIAAHSSVVLLLPATGLFSLSKWAVLERGIDRRTGGGRIRHRLDASLAMSRQRHLYEDHCLLHRRPDADLHGALLQDAVV